MLNSAGPIEKLRVGIIELPLSSSLCHNASFEAHFSMNFTAGFCINTAVNNFCSLSPNIENIIVMCNVAITLHIN